MSICNDVCLNGIMHEQRMLFARWTTSGYKAYGIIIVSFSNLHGFRNIFNLIFVFLKMLCEYSLFRIMTVVTCRGDGWEMRVLCLWCIF